MEADCLSFKETGYFSKIIIDYLDENPDLEDFYSLYPTLDNFEKAIGNKKFSNENRKILADSLKEQYKKNSVKLSEGDVVLENIRRLENSKTFTISTGHQLCLFTGPLYFIYKIVSVFKLCDSLKYKYPEYDFVPIYWMATEDHDFDEVNHFFAGEKKFSWRTEQKGAVGRMHLNELETTIQEFESWLTDYSSNAEELKKLFRQAYTKHTTLAAATRYIVHELFREYGVVIIDGDDQRLKRLFVPTIKKELQEEFSAELVDVQSKNLSKQYKIQVNPRDINLFYLKDNLRERIVKENDVFFVNDTEISFSEKEILAELDKHPERFSPNVLLRPVYQESILPNLAYIGGGGELAYWFQLKSVFEAVEIPMPIVVLRNSVMWLNNKQTKIFKQLGISFEQLFLQEGILVKEWVKGNSKIDLELSEQKTRQLAFFDELQQVAKEIDQSLEDHVESLSTKHIRALEQLSEKLIRAERRKSKVATERIAYLKNSLFQDNGLQERRLNFSEIYLSHGKGMIEELVNSFTTPTNDFLIIN